MKHLHTGQFKQVYKDVKSPIPYLNFLILGFLVWLEQLYLDYTIKANLDSAIDDYHKQMDRLEKWHKFLRSIYDSTRTQVPPLSQNNLNMDGYDTWVAVSDLSRYGSLQFTITARTQMRLARLSIVCEHLLASQLCRMSLTQSCVSQMGCVVLLKYHVSLSLDCYN